MLDHSVADLRFGPVGMALPQPGGQQLAHASIHAQGLQETVLRRHGAVDVRLNFIGNTNVLGLNRLVGHATKLIPGGFDSSQHRSIREANFGRN